MPLNVLYIDDEPDLCRMFVDNFESTEIKIHTIHDLRYLADEIEKISPDLAIIDYRLPHTTGDAIARRLKPEVPKVLISGDLTIKPDLTYLHIFSKPFNFDEMEAFLQSLAAKKLAQALQKPDPVKR